MSANPLMGVQLANVRTNAEGPEFALSTKYTAPNGKQYKYVQYNGGAGSVAAVAGNFTYALATGGVSAGQHDIVTSDLSDSAGVGTGVLQAVIATTGYGWIQTKGLATLTPALTAGADGNALTAVGASDGTIDVSALVTDFICAVAVDASAKIVLLTCPD